LPAATELAGASENGPRGYDLAQDLHETKEGRMGNLTAMKMEAETDRRGLAGENGGQQSSSTVRRNSAAARFRWRDDGKTEPELGGSS
jgi:hypothetical protein